MRSSEISPNPFGAPSCRKCHRTLKRRVSLGFWEALEEIIASICDPFHRTLYGCTGTVPNEKYDVWKEDCKKIDEKNKKIRRQNMVRQFIGSKKPEIPYPPRPPRRVPCPNHYKLRPFGKYNQRSVRKRKTFYDGGGNIYYI